MRSFLNDMKDTGALLWAMARGKGARTDYMLLGSVLVVGVAVGWML